LRFTYDLNLAATSFTESIRRNLLRELREELGGAAAEEVQFGGFLSGERITTLRTLKLPDSDASREIA